GKEEAWPRRDDFPSRRRRAQQPTLRLSSPPRDSANYGVLDKGRSAAGGDRRTADTSCAISGVLQGHIGDAVVGAIDAHSGTLAERADRRFGARLEGVDRSVRSE